VNKLLVSNTQIVSKAIKIRFFRVFYGDFPKTNIAPILKLRSKLQYRKTSLGCLVQLIFRGFSFLALLLLMISKSGNEFIFF